RPNTVPTTRLAMNIVNGAMPSGRPTRRLRRPLKPFYCLASFGDPRFLRGSLCFGEIVLMRFTVERPKQTSDQLLGNNVYEIQLSFEDKRLQRNPIPCL